MATELPEVVARRQQRILDLARHTGSVAVDTLASELGVKKLGER